MLDKWNDIGRSRIFADKSRGGLLSLFLKDYKDHFGGTIYPSCGKCLSSYWFNYTNLKTEIMKEIIKCDFVLKTKYNGIQLGVNGQPIRNGEMTNKIAKELLDKHPRGADLFDVLPEIIESESEEVVLEDMKLSELKELFPSIKANTKAKFLKKISDQNLN